MERERDNWKLAHALVGVMSSTNHHTVVPNWNMRQQQRQLQQQQEVVDMGGGERVGEDGNRFSHVQNQMLVANHHHHHHHPSSMQHFQVEEEVHLQPAPHQQEMSNYDEVAELTWENGQLAMHGLGGLTPTAQEKTTWGRAGDTLESIVHLATFPLPPANIVSTTNGAVSGAGKWAESPSNVKKRLRSESENCGALNNSSIGTSSRRRNTALLEERSACASGSATFCTENQNDSTMMTWPSFDSSRSLRTKTVDEDSASHGGTENRDEERETKGETGRSSTKRASRAAAVHNQSERRRRDRINQKMKDLQKLVPNASKTDKASMLDEVIEYLKQLQAQVQLMSSARNNMPQMMMPLAMQQQIQMSLLARMGMGVGLGMGMGMMDMSGMPRSSPQSLPPLIHPAAATNPAASAFMPIMPPLVPTRSQPQPTPSAATPNNPNPFNDPYCAFLAQSMNMEIYNKMSALYSQQLSQTVEATSRPSSSSHDQRG